MNLVHFGGTFTRSGYTMRHLLLKTAVFLVAANFGFFANADLIMQFGQGGAIGVTSFSAMVGTPLQIDVYLTQSGTYDLAPGFSFGDYRLSNNNTTANGLGSFYFELGVSNAQDGLAQSGLRPSSPFTFVYGPFIDATGENGFLDGAGNVTPNQTSQARYVGFAPFDSPTTVSPRFVTQAYDSKFNELNTGTSANNSLLLGTITLEPSAPGDFTLSLSAPGSIQRSTLGSDPLGGQFDAVFGSANVNVSAVPEPSGLVLTGLACALTALRRRRR